MNLADTAMIQKINESKRKQKKESKCPKCGGELTSHRTIDMVYCINKCGYELIF